MDCGGERVAWPVRWTRRGKIDLAASWRAGRTSADRSRRCRTGNNWVTVIVVNVTFYSLVTYSEQRKH